MVDTHCHLNIMIEKKPDALLGAHDLVAIEQIVKEAGSAGVHTIINVGTSYAESLNSVMIAQHCQGNGMAVYATLGIHPCDVDRAERGDWRNNVQQLDHLLAAHVVSVRQAGEREVVVGLGETGLDFYHKPYDQNAQRSVFLAHIERAIAHDLPLVVHVRDAGQEALQILERYKHEARGVIHCFSLDNLAAQEVASWGWKIGIDGPVTYKKNDFLREIVAKAPFDQLLLETDAPFLTPQAHRGKPNHPHYLPYIAQCIAQQRNVSIQDVVEQTTHNAQQLFALPPHVAK